LDLCENLGNTGWWLGKITRRKLVRKGGLNFISLYPGASIAADKV